MNKLHKYLPWSIMVLGAVLFGLMLMQFQSNGVHEHQKFNQESENLPDADEPASENALSSVQSPEVGFANKL